MKHFILISALLFSFNGWAECNYPKMDFNIPAGWNASESEMIEAQNNIKLFQKDLSSFRKCLDIAVSKIPKSSSNYKEVKRSADLKFNASVDNEESLTDRWDCAVKTYKSGKFDDCALKDSIKSTGNKKPAKKQSTQNKINKSAKKRIVSETNGLITQLNRVKGVTELDKRVARSQKNYALSIGIGKNNTISYGLCSNYETKNSAMACAEVFCRKNGNNCRSIQVNDAYAKNGLEHSEMIMDRLGWDDNQGSTQSRSTNNQSQQLSTYDLCLQRLQSSRKNYQCTVPPTKQGGIYGFAVQVNACRAQAQRAYPDSICYGISQPRYEAPQQNNSVQLCNFKCWGGQIVQGDCNTPAVTVNGKSCPRM